MNRFREALDLFETLRREGPKREVLRQILDAFLSLIACERAYLFRLRRGGGFQVTVARNHDREDISEPLTRISHYAVQRMVEEGSEFVVDNPRQDRRYRTEEALRAHRGPLLIRVFPLRSGDDVCGGVYTDHRFQAPVETSANPELIALLLGLLEIAFLLREERDRIARERRVLEARGLPRSENEDDAEVRPRPSIDVLLNEPSEAESFQGMLSANPDVLDVFDTLQKVEDSSLPILILGETGTGKGALAAAAHRSSRRAARPFVVVDCGSLPENLVESELLGHVKGAFTGAEHEREGAFVEAHGGTLVLDGIAELNESVQTKLLRVLSEGRVRPVGGKDERAVDVRVICACRRNLERDVREGRFRRDLYFRLKGIVLDLPPLRDRPEDILPLVACFAQRHGGGAVAPQLSPSAKRRLLQHAWPGNVRELENEVRRWFAFGMSNIRAEDLKTLTSSMAVAPSIDGGSGSLEEVVHLAEKEAILETLRRVQGNKSRAAKALGVTRKALYRRLAKYGIDD